MHAVWSIEPGFAMPAGVVENEHDGPFHARFGLAREGFEQRRKVWLRHPSCTYQNVSPLAGETKVVT